MIFRGFEKIKFSYFMVFFFPSKGNSSGFRVVMITTSPFDAIALQLISQATACTRY